MLVDLNGSVVGLECRAEVRRKPGIEVLRLLEQQGAAGCLRLEQQQKAGPSLRAARLSPVHATFWVMVNEVVIASLYCGPSLVLLVIQTHKTLQIPIVLLSKRKVEGPMKLDTEILSLK